MKALVLDGPVKGVFCVGFLSSEVECSTWIRSSRSGAGGLFDFSRGEVDEEAVVGSVKAGEGALRGGAMECSLESISIFSSFSSSRAFNSRVSASRALTRSSNDSV